MVHKTYFKLLLAKNNNYSCSRQISKYIHRDISSRNIRQNFLDFFIKEKGHAFVKSSPVVPFCDPTVPFVNAGMNQFKGIFLGSQIPHFTKVANSQKCIRIGGKHNDLNIVGKDGYHHTFFEMLGNWSFGDYFKKEACEMAWELLTKVYKIPPSRLYVTYFGGNDVLELGPDLETKDIWKSLGLKDDRILPFGSKDNFWEMGLTGPCGPCTEIHYDHIGKANRAAFVNKDLHDLTELWNIVFIEYNRCSNGTIQSLPRSHVDTGLGLERLACALQGKLSTYDTDLFDYLINAISKNCNNIPKYSGNFGEQDWNNLDTSYRILSDHMRAIVASLADGVIPEENQKLRRLMRRCFNLSQKVFLKDEGLIKELSNYVVENLGVIYPEMEKNIKQVQNIIDFEEDLYKSLKESAKKEFGKLECVNIDFETTDFDEITPSFILAYKELTKLRPSKIKGDIAFKLYDTYGLDDSTIQQLSGLLNIEYDSASFKQKMHEVKMKSKGNHPHQLNNHFATVDLDKTNDSGKYNYTKVGRNYIFPNVSAKILKIIQNDKDVTHVKNGSFCSLILDRTNLYSEAGGQQSDKGTITFENGNFQVESVLNANDVLLHQGYVEGNLNTGTNCTVSVNAESRLRCMQNHTSTHLLNSAVKHVKKTTCQKSSKVTDLFMNLDVAIFGDKMAIADVEKIESLIGSIIKKNIDVQVTVTDSQGLYSLENVTLIPGEVYPDNNIRIIEVDDGDNFISREPCCGTHILNTGDIEDFCIITLKSLGRSTVSLYAVTGKRAKLARRNGEELQDDITVLKKTLSEHLDNPELVGMALLSLKQRLNFDPTDNSILPIVAKHQILGELKEIDKKIKDSGKDNLKNFIDMEMQEALKTCVEETKSKKKYLIHYLRTSVMLESAPLQRATKVCPNIPVIIIAYSDSVVKARCCVPKECQNDSFNAEKWLKTTVASVFKSKASAPKGQDCAAICNMKPRKVHSQNWEGLLEESLESAKKYVDENL